MALNSSVVFALLACALFALCWDGVTADDAKENKFREDCIKQQTDLSPAEVDRIVAGKLFDKKVGDASKALKCFAKCMFVKRGLITESGQQNSVALTQAMSKVIPDQAKLQSAMAACAKIGMNKDLCESAYNFEACVREMA